jgi:predicted nucleic acid-binding protein
MKITDLLQQVARLFVDTAPIVYFVEQHPQYTPLVTPLFQAVDAGTIQAVTSPITLAETLVLPYRQGQASVQQAFFSTIVSGHNTQFVPIDANHSREAAQLRSRYNLSLTDAFQVAVALTAGCDAFLTNDYGLRRVQELHILIVDELEL